MVRFSFEEAGPSDSKGRSPGAGEIPHWLLLCKFWGMKRTSYEGFMNVVLHSINHQRTEIGIGPSQVPG
jgi:hypothetical protein